MAKLFLFLWGLVLALPAGAESIKLYLYHQQPPFVIGEPRDQRGLMFDLSELLNRHALPDTRFEPALRPRSRLNRELAPWISGECPGSASSCENNWMVFWVTPAWGWGAQAEQRFLWVDLFQDQDLIISGASRPIEYQGTSSLLGHSFAAMRGNYYPQGVEELMQQGRIARLDGNSQRSVLLRVARARADVGLMQRSAFDYYLAQDAELSSLRDQLYIARQPFEAFTLQVMIPADRPDLQQFLQEQKSTAAWREVFAHYGIQAL